MTARPLTPEQRAAVRLVSHHGEAVRNLNTGRWHVGLERRPAMLMRSLMRRGLLTRRPDQPMFAQHTLYVLTPAGRALVDGGES